MRNWLCLALLVAGSAAAADRPDLTGTWKLDLAHSQTGDEKVQSGTLLIHQTEDKISITDNRVAPDGKEKKLEVECNTMGKECKLKEGSFSLYYNGPVLVMVQTHGSDLAVKRRFSLSPDGARITMEVIHLSPPGKPDESYVFVKQ
jgi:hypothetical protein